MQHPVLIALFMLGAFFVTCRSVSAQAPRFDRVSVQEGLSHDKVLSILQDRRGFLWFGTMDGLNRYDGYSFTVFQNIPFDTTSLAGDIVYAVYEDRDGVLWVGTNGGLSRLDRARGRFTNFLPEEARSNRPWANDVGFLLEDRTEEFWVGTFGGGLYRMDRAAGTFTHYGHDPDDTSTLSIDIVESIYEDRTGTIWVTTMNGLNRFDRDTETFTRFLYPEDDLYTGSVVDMVEDAHDPGVFWMSTITGLVRFTPATGEVRRFITYPSSTSLQGGPWWSMPQGIAVDPRSPEILWVAVPREGLYRFDTRRETATLFDHEHDDPHSVSGEPHCVYLDRSGIIWIGTNRGVNWFEPALRRFRHYLPGVEGAPPLLHTRVSALHESRDGTLWVGTGDFLVGTALTRIDRATGAATHWLPPPSRPAGLPDNIGINAIYEDSDGALWIGTIPRADEATLIRFDPETGNFSHWKHDPGNPDGLGAGGVTALAEDRRGFLWIGTSEGGLSRMGRTTGVMKAYRHRSGEPGTLAGDAVRAIMSDQKGRLWIATNAGLCRLDVPSDRFVCYRQDANTPGGLSSNNLYALYEQASEPGVLWIGTATSLDRFDTGTGSFKSLSAKDGLPPFPVVTLLEDRQGWLWLGTSGGGLFSYNPETGMLLRYDETSGVQGRRFAPGAAFRSARTGEMFLGGVNGLNVFLPEQVRDLSTPPAVELTDFKLFGKSVEVGADSPLRRPIWDTRDIRLEHDQNAVSFDFVALHYRNSARNQYAYRLEGLDEDWVSAGSRRSATYTNLQPGAYRFQVKAANAEGVWNPDGASVHLVILPPWWSTWWAYALYAVVAFGLIVAADHLRRGQVLRRERAASLLLEKELRADAAEAWANYLQAENERQMAELETARQLQLSLLPRRVPEHAAVEIAAYMKTATEVGGDYYDFAVSEDGTLTVAIGDATGHGIQAGTMVTVAKSIFTGFAHEPDLNQLLKRAARVFRKMGLPKLFMAMALLRVHEQVLEIAGTGMPAALVYHSSTGHIEEVPLKGIPLGGPEVGTYRHVCLSPAPGDTIVLMSDGFPELFNENGEMLGYERVSEIFREVAGASPAAVIEHFRETMDQWGGGRPQGDDVTFVVLRATPHDRGVDGQSSAVTSV